MMITGTPAKSLLMSSLVLIVSGGCGGSFDSRGEVTRVAGDEVCVNTNSNPAACFDVGTADGDDDFAVGDCVELRHAGESGRVTRAEIVECASIEDEASSTAPSQEPGPGVLELDGSAFDVTVTTCELEPRDLTSPAFDDLVQLLFLEGQVEVGPNELPLGVEILQGRGPGDLLTEKIWVWEGDRTMPSRAWVAEGASQDNGSTSTTSSGSSMLVVTDQVVTGEGMAIVSGDGARGGEQAAVRVELACL